MDSRYPGSNLLFEEITNIADNNNLLICIGDSWTWGDSLSPALQNSNLDNQDLIKTRWDYEHRKEKCYGNHLSNMLDADWLNYAIPGSCNKYIYERFCLELKKHQERSNKYKNIYYVLCLTETGREVASETVTEKYTTELYLQALEQKILDKINSVYSYDKQKLIVCRNFTSSYPTTAYDHSNLKSWIQVNAEDENIDIESLAHCGPVTRWGTKPILDNPHFTDAKEWFIKNSNSSRNTINYMFKSKYHNKKASKHPSPQSHIMWAEYLYRVLGETDRKVNITND